jgi:hypothetical protein
MAKLLYIAAFLSPSVRGMGKPRGCATVKLKIKELEWEIPPQIYRFAAVVTIGVLITSAILSSRGGNIESDISTHRTKLKFQQPTHNQFMEVNPALNPLRHS